MEDTGAQMGLGDGMPFIDLEHEDPTIPMDVFYNIMQETPHTALPDNDFYANQVKTSAGESDDEHRLNTDVPSVGLGFLDSPNLLPHNEASSNSQFHKEADSGKAYGLQGTGESSLSELPDASLSDCLNLSAGDSFQPDDLCGTPGSSQSDMFQDYPGLTELPFMSPVDSERVQLTNGSVLASDWMPLSTAENNTSANAHAVNSLNTSREARIFGFFDENPLSQNLKLNSKNIDKPVSVRSSHVPTLGELVDLTQTDSSDDDLEMRTEQFGKTKQFGTTSRYQEVNTDVRRKLPSWGTSGKGLMNKESKEKTRRNLAPTDASDWNHRKPPINAQERRVVGLQFQGASGAASNAIFTEKKPVAGNFYQHSEFGFEQKPQVKEDWMGGASSSNWKSGSVNVDVEVNQKPNLNDISYFNDESDQEDMPDINMRRHLPSTLAPASSWTKAEDEMQRHFPPALAPASSWTKAEDERQTYRAALLDLAQPTVEAIPDDGLLAVPLLRHQRIALAWMVQKETNNMHCAGGILADDQGLGKTVSTVALILKERPAYQFSQEDTSQVKLETSAVNLDEDDIVATGFERKFTNNSNDLTSKESTHSVKKGRPSAGTLVVCPTSVLRQWAQEIREKVTEKANLSVLVYHGSNRTKDPNELAKYDVVLTTYSIVSMEVPKQELGDDSEEAEKSRDYSGVIDAFTEKKKKKTAPETAKKKNRKGANGSSSELSPRPLAKVGWFRVVLDEAQSIKNHRTQVARACWGLRAKRRWCLSGTPIQNSIDDLYSYFRFLKYDPYAVYRSFCSTLKLPISRNPVTGYKKLQAVLKTIMLRRTKGTFIDGEPIIKLPPKTITLKKVEFSLEERDFYHKLELDSKARFKVYADAGTVKQNYVNILLMLLRLRQACDHPLLVKACSPDSTWRSSAETARNLPEEKRNDLINGLEHSLAICGICNDAPEVAVVTLCGHVFCNQCISAHLTQSDDTVCPFPNCKCQLKADSVFSLATLQNSISSSHMNNDNLETDSNFEDQRAASSKIKAALETLQALPKLCTSIAKNTCGNNTDKECCLGGICDDIVQENASEFSEELNRDMQPSLKKQVVEISEKAIVFSQWTSMLDLLEIPLKNSGIQYRRLDGTMSVLARDKAVNDFKTLPEVTVMIMSLKAASLGLNMVAACHVVLLDLWWNPTTEDQAIDRAHRIGQTRPVQVSRFTVKDTVEDRILALQEKKRQMVSSAFGEDEAGGRQSHLTEEDLRYLFMM